MLSARTKRQIYQLWINVTLPTQLCQICPVMGDTMLFLVPGIGVDMLVKFDSLILNSWQLRIYNSEINTISDEYIEYPRLHKGRGFSDNICPPYKSSFNYLQLKPLLLAILYS